LLLFKCSVECTAIELLDVIKWEYFDQKLLTVSRDRTHVIKGTTLKKSYQSILPDMNGKQEGWIRPLKL
jgi:hypothetical protein